MKSNKYFIMMRGTAGTGKSTFSKAIAGSLDAVVIENDVIRNQIRKLLCRKDTLRTVFIHNKAVRKATYSIAYKLLSQNIEVNHSVILDSSSLRLKVYRNCSRLAKGKCKLIVCECYCSNLDILSERLKKRTYSWQVNSLKKSLQGIKMKDILPTKYLIQIDTSKPIKSNVKKFLTYVKSIEKIN